MHDQNINVKNSSCGKTQTRATTRQNDNSNGNGRLNRNTSSTRRTNNSSNKLEVFTEFDLDEGASTGGSSERKSQSQSTESCVQMKCRAKLDISKGSSCTNGQGSARSVKSRSKGSRKTNENTKNISSNVKVVEAQNGSQSLKGKGNCVGKEEGVSTHPKWQSKANLKLGQVVSKNSKSAQNSKVSQVKTVSPKQSEVEEAKMSTQKGKLSPKIISTKTSPNQDSMVVERKRKLDSGTQTAEPEILSKMAKKQIYFSIQTETSAQRSKGLDNNQPKEEISTSTLAGSCEQNTDSKQELDLELCASREEYASDDRPTTYTDLHLMDSSEKAPFLSTLLVSSDHQDIAVDKILETERKTEENLPELNDNREQKFNDRNSDQDQTVEMSVEESNTPCTTPVKRSARISERRLRQKFNDEVFDKSLWITSPSKSQRRLNLGMRTNSVMAKKSVKHNGMTANQRSSAKCTEQSTAAKPVATVKSNNKSRSRTKHMHARIKFTPLHPRTSSAKLNTDIASEQCRISVGDIVWGKVHGHPWWPGRVLAVSGNTGGTGLVSRDAHVAWFGSNTSSIMAAHELAAFTANFKKRFRRNKRGPYRTAVHEAQEAAKALEGVNS